MSDRKYRQRGYQDKDRGSGRGGRSSGPKGERPEGPRGRGLGRPTRSVFRCRDCGEPAVPATLEPESRCARCERPLHSCVNCSFFDPASRWECRAAIEQPVRGKAAANDCSHYEPKLVMVSAEEQTSSPDDARAAFDRLFDL